MNWKHVAGALLLVGMLALGLGAAYYTGAGPAPGGSDSDKRLTDFPTATPTDENSIDSEAGSTATVTTTPFSFTIDNVEECGTTCRDVTATLNNNQEETATSVTVYTRVFAGQDNNDPADLVWEGKEEVGTLGPGEAHTNIRRVELSLQEAQKIQRNDGWITIVTIVQTDERTVTFRDSEQVT